MFNNNNGVDKNTTANITIIKVNKIHKQHYNNVYIYRDFEKAKS